MQGHWAYTISNVASAIAAMFSGYYWLKAATVSVQAPTGAGMGAVLDGGIYDKDDEGKLFDVLKTARLQAGWNKKAAFAAFGAAALQVIAMLANMFPTG